MNLCWYLAFTYCSMFLNFLAAVHCIAYAHGLIYQVRTPPTCSMKFVTCRPYRIHQRGFKFPRISRIRIQSEREKPGILSRAGLQFVKNNSLLSVLFDCSQLRFVNAACRSFVLNGSIRSTKGYIIDTVQLYSFFFVETVALNSLLQLDILQL
jgi:hypothetical protein